MKSVNLSKRSRNNPLRVEAPGCVVNITAGLFDADGYALTHVTIDVDGDRNKGENQWWVNGEADNRGLSCSVIQTNTPTRKPPRFALFVRIGNAWDRSGIDASADALATFAETSFPGKEYRIEPLKAEG